MNAPFDIDTVTNAAGERFKAPTPQTAGVLITGAANRLGRVIALDSSQASSAAAIPVKVPRAVPSPFWTQAE